jgi:hypothetical protein
MMFSGMNFYAFQPYSGAPFHLQQQRRATGRYIKVKFSPEEDARLLDLVAEHGTKDWMTVSALMGNRNARQCRERYKNYLDRALSNTQWTADEDRLLADKVKEFGTRWNKVAVFFTNRSDMALRNRWQMIERRRAKGETLDSVESEAVTSFSGDETSAPQSPVADVVPVTESRGEAPKTETKMFDNPFELFDAFYQEPVFDEDPFRVCMWGAEW